MNLKMSITNPIPGNKFLGVFLLGLLIGLSQCTTKNTSKIVLEEEPTNYAAKEIPVHAEIQLPEKLRNVSNDELSVTLQTKSGKFSDVPGQITESATGERELWWILPETTDNKVEWDATIKKDSSQQKTGFKWVDTPNKHLDLFLDGRRVFRYSYQLDEHLHKGKTLTERNKPFYHIYDLQGTSKITNGPEEGVWSHHRGIMIGWRNVGFQGQDLSFWGMEDLTVQKHIKFIKNVAGPVLAQTEALIHWNDSTGTTIIEEKRQATIYRQAAPDLLVLDFKSTLKAVNGAVNLDGNAEHGGVQFRAHNDVAEGAPGSKKPTYYFNKDNIDPHKDFNLPWVGMSYGLNNKTYSILQMDNPENPRPTVWSAYRDYGRFGPFFSKKLAANESFTVRYRFWMGEENMPARNVLSEKYQAYIHPVKIQVVE